ncbi:MAG: hypothetical protein D6736_11155 [Nitrospinota bacterium]|nr:MAG: hypothetical protein D6736_11155 [Nitrospinota bacterium]
MCCSDELAAIVQDVNQFQDNLKRLKEALEALAKALEELQPVLEKLIKLGDQLADTTLKLVKELLSTVRQLISEVSNLFKDVLKLVKEVLKITIIFPLFQKLFDISIASTVTIQPFEDVSISEPSAIKDEEIIQLQETGIASLKHLVQADTRVLIRCGFNPERIALLQQQAQQAIRPFGDEFTLLIEELDDTLAEIKGKSENDFILNRDAIRAIQLDIHSRTTVLKPDVFHRFRVRDVYDVAVPVGYSQDCPPLDAAFAEEINKLGVLVQ